MKKFRIRNAVAVSGSALVLGLIAGTASAAQITSQTFDTQPVNSPNEAPGVWYPDRFPPATFESHEFNGDNRLHVQVTQEQQQSNGFNNFQGRKFDTPGANQLSIDLYVDSDWDTATRRTGLWGTATDSDGNVSAYPILEFTNKDSTDSGFYYYTNDTDQDNSNGFQPGSVSVLDLGTGDFAEWYTLSLSIDEGDFLASISDTNGNELASFRDSSTYNDFSQFANAIVNTGNFGETYDVYYDNFSAVANANAVPEPSSILLMGFGLGMILMLVRRRRNLS